MRHRSWLGAAVLVGTLVASNASADVPAAAPASEPARTPGTVRANLRKAPKVRGVVRLFTASESGQEGKLVCEAPCRADVYPGTLLRIVYGEDYEHGYEFVMHGKPGGDLDLEVRPASKGALAGGIVLVSIGGLVAFIGAVLAVIGANVDGPDRDLFVPGLVTLAIGGGMTIGGIFLIAGRSKTPRTKELEVDPGAHASRASLFGDDLASLRPRSPVATPFTPLVWRVSF